MDTKTQVTLETLNDGPKTSLFKISIEALELIRDGLHIIVHTDLQNPVFQKRIIEFNLYISHPPPFFFTYG